MVPQTFRSLKVNGEGRKGSHKQPKEPRPCDCSVDKASGTHLCLKKDATQCLVWGLKPSWQALSRELSEERAGVKL